MNKYLPIFDRATAQSTNLPNPA